jgi:hypothetical protein
MSDKCPPCDLNKFGLDKFGYLVDPSTQSGCRTTGQGLDPLIIVAIALASLAFLIAAGFGIWLFCKISKSQVPKQ